MRRRSVSRLARSAGVALVLAAVTAAGAGAADPAVREFAWHAHLARGATIRISSAGGDIFIQRSDDGDASLRAVPRGGADANALVRVGVAANGTTIDTAAANDRAPTDELLLVPAGVNVVARTAKGRIVAEDAPGDVDATTLDGDIHLTAMGSLKATAANGSIVASIPEGNVGTSWSFRSDNGSIAIDAPANAKIAVRALAANDAVTTAFPRTSGATVPGAATVDAVATKGSVTVTARR